MNQDARGRLLAVDHVTVEAPPDSEQSMRWFYGELIGLVQRPQAESAETSGVIVYRCEKVELRISLRESPRIESIACRAMFEVKSLVATAAQLLECKYPFQWRRGLTPTERVLFTQDPAGNRVELRRFPKPGLF